MKKLIAVLTILMLFTGMFGAHADGAMLPATETNECRMQGEAWVALCAETHRLFGKVCECENLPVYPAETTQNNGIVGLYDTGIIREKGEMRYMDIGGTVYGLTSVNAYVSIQEEYYDAVKTITERRMNGDVTVSNVVACTIGVTENTVYHYMFRSDMDKVPVGNVIFSEKAQAVLYMGDWNGDGLMELGFIAGMGKARQETPTPSSTPEPAPQPTQAPKSNNQGQSKVIKATKDSTCTKTVSTTNTTIVQVQVNNQVNIGGTITNNQTVNTGSGCKTPVQKKNCFE